MDPRSKHATWIEIDLAAIEGNARVLKGMTGAELMAVVKANGYGHGPVETVRSAARGGASWAGVARPDEALQLRDAGIEESILVLGPAPRDSLEGLVGREIAVTVTDEREIDYAAHAARTQDTQARVHLKIDTGMSRLGALPEAAVALAQRLRGDDAIHFEGLFTHFARADERDATSNEEQLAQFGQILGELEALDLRPPVIHAANSAATIQMPGAHFDMVRVGIALYGLQASKDWELPQGFRPAMQWKTQLTRVQSLPPNTGVSYGHEYFTRGQERIGTIPVGYADGLRRTSGNQVLVDGEPVPVIGRVCMDLSMVQLDEVGKATVEDEVVLLGEQGGRAITAEQVADRWGTVNYEVTCGISERVPRIYR